MRRELLARLAVSHFYALEGILVGIWSSELPTLQDDLELDDAELGLASLFSYLGSIIATFIAECLISKFGSKSPTVSSAILFCTSLITIAFCTNFLTACIAMFYFGITMGLMDVAMNASGVTTETVYGVLIFSTFHASYSFSASAASFIGGALQSLSFSITEIFAGVSVTMLVTTVVASNYLYSSSDEKCITAGGNPSDKIDDKADLLEKEDIITESTKHKELKVNFWSLRLSYYLCAVGFLAALGECSLVTWCAVFISRYIDESPVVASVGLSVFMIFMGTGRMLGDSLRKKFGVARIIFVAGLLSSSGIILMFCSSWMKSDTNTIQLVAVLTGIAMTGCGLSTLIPGVFITGGRIPGVEVSLALARLSIFTNLGAVAGPPLVGIISTLFNDLKFAFLGLAAILLVISFLCFGFENITQTEVFDEKGEANTDGENRFIRSDVIGLKNHIIISEVGGSLNQTIIVSDPSTNSLLKPLLL